MASYLLDTTLNKLRHISLGLKRRDQRFFDRCIEAEMNKNHMKAIIYANECAEVRRLAGLVISSELALEHAILRLQTISEVSNVMVAVSPILSIVQETKGRLAGIIPSVAGKLDEVNTVLRSSMSEMGSIYSSEASIAGIKSDEEAIKILKEANEAAEEKIRERFPELPQELETPEEPTEARIPVALTALGADIDLGEKGVPEDLVKAISKLKDERKIILE